MKKYISYALLIVLLLSLASCNQAEGTYSPTEEDIGRLLVASDSESKFNYKNAIPHAPTSVHDSTVPAQRAVEINRQEVLLRYEETLLYRANDERLFRYVSANDEGTASVLLREDGSISSLLYSFMSLEITGTESPEEIYQLLLNSLGAWVDLTVYQHVELPDAATYNEGRFGSYTFLFYNEWSGVMSDWLRVSVNNDGDVSGLSQKKIGELPKEIVIDSERVRILLEEKLKEIYTTEDTEYVSFRMREDFLPEVIRVDGELFVRYWASAEYETDSGAHAVGYLETVYIPIELLCQS